MSRDPKNLDADTAPAPAESRVRTAVAVSKAWGPLPELEPIVVGRYRIGYLVGRGSFAHVYRATHVTIPSIVYAVKVLRRGASEDPSLRERFRLEAEAASSIRSPHVAPVIDFGETKAGLPFLVMPLLVGLPCDRLLTQIGCLRPADVARFSLDVLDALEVAHDHGVIHRDLKPSNIFIEQAPAGRHPMAKVLDFGIAKLLEESTLAPVIATAVNSFVGTPAFASPEALSGEPDPRGDLYALGHAMANMLDGRAPYEGEKTQALAIRRHLSPERVPLGENTTRSGLAEIVARACEKSAFDRFQTASDMAEAIRATGLDQLDVAPLEFVPGGVPEPDPTDDVLTNVQRPAPPGRGSSSSVQHAGLASTLGPEETPAEPHPLTSEVGASLLAQALLDTEDVTEPDGVEAIAPESAAPRRSAWPVAIVLMALLGAVALALAIGPGRAVQDEPPTAQEPASAALVDDETGEGSGAIAVVEGSPTEEYAAPGPAAEPRPEPSIAPAIRQAMVTVARSSRVDVDNVVDLAGSVEGIEAWLGDVRLGLLPLRGAYVPSARPLTFRFVGDQFELTHVVERTGPVVHRVEPPPRRRRRSAEAPPANDETTASAPASAPPVSATPETPPEPADPEAPDGDPSLFGPPQTDLRNPFE